MEKGYIECYQIKSKVEGASDKIVLSKPDNDDYQTLYVILPEGYERRCGPFGELEIYNPDGFACHLERIGKNRESNPLVVYPIRFGKYEEVELTFYNEKPEPEE